MLKYLHFVAGFASHALLTRRYAGGQRPRKTMRMESLESRVLLSTSVPAQTINTDTTWTLANSPYNLTGDVTIGAAGSLTIQAGVTVTADRNFGTLYRLVVGSGGTISANAATFSSQVIVQNGSAGSISNSTFNAYSEFDATSLTVTGDRFNANPNLNPVFVPQLTTAANGNSFAPGTLLNIQAQSVNTALEWPAVSNVASYHLVGNVTVASGGALTIDSGVTETASTNFGTLYSLTIASGATLNATNAAFGSQVVVQNGAAGSITGSTFNAYSEFDTTAFTTTGDQFNSNPTAIPSYVPQLSDPANSNSFLSGTVLNVGAGTLSTALTWPAIPNVSAYNLTGTVTIANGGALTVNGGVTLTAGSFFGTPFIISVGSGGSLSATGVKFVGGVTFGAGSGGSLTYDTFYTANSLVINGASTASINNDNFGLPLNIVSSQGTGGPINLEMNWWGVTTDQAIAAKITDHASNASLPVIDHSNWLTAAPVLAGTPLVTQQPANQTVAPGQVVSFAAVASGTPAPAVQWQSSSDGVHYSNIAGATSLTYTFTASQGQNGNLFQAVFTNSVGTATSTPATLTVSGTAPAAPTVTAQPQAQSTTAGQVASFSAGATGNPAPTVQWQTSTDGVNYTDIPGASATTYTFIAAAGQNGNFFRAVFNNGLGSATTSPATLIVASSTTPAAPTVVVQPTDQSAPIGQVATFAAAAGGNPIPTVQWQTSTDGVTYTNIAGATSSAYTISATAAINQTLYRAVFTNSQGSATSSPAMLSVTSANPQGAPLVTAQPLAQSVSVGQTATFTAAATGVPAPAVQWQISTDGTTFVNIPGATATTYSFAPAASQSGNLLRAVFTNSAGSVASSPVLLTAISTSASSGITVTRQPVVQSVLSGQPITLTAVATGTPPPSVQWQISSNGIAYTNIAGATSATYSFLAAPSLIGTLLRAVFTNANGSIATTPVSPLITVATTSAGASIIAPDVTSGGGSGQTVTVVYSSASAAINVATISSSNLTVTGPNNVALPARVFNTIVSGNSATVTYVVSAPGGAWLPVNNGVYSVVVKPGAVLDVNGAATAGASSSFIVSAATKLVVKLRSATTAIDGQSQSFTAVVSTGAAGGPVPTGTVTFFSDGTPIGTAPLDATATATLAIGSLPVNAHAIVASYGGDGTHPAAFSAVPTLVVVAPALEVLPAFGGTLTPVVVAGRKTVINQTLSVTNSSGSVLNGPISVTYYLSTDTTIDTDSIALQTTTRIFKLDNNRRSLLKFKLPALPASVSPGTYYLVALLKDAGGRTSIAASAHAIVVQAPVVDLSGIFFNTPASQKIGQKISASLLITQLGSVPVHGPLSIVLYWSLKNTFDQTAATQITRVTRVINLEPEKPKTIRLSRLSLPASAGEYFLIARLDPNNAFGEANGADNTFASNRIAVS